jgi:formylglycine-generating enzyme required for sulfatase activity
MVRVEGGELAPQKRRKRVKVAAFCLDTVEVTVGAYADCVRRGACKPACLAAGRCELVPVTADWPDAREAQRASAFCNGRRAAHDDHPMNCVAQEEAAEHCAARKARLPTASEWEWAVRGADAARSYPWGTSPREAGICWSRVSVKNGTCPTASSPSDVTPQGVFDLAGNVSEWVARSEGSGTIFGASWYDVDDGYLRAALGGLESLAPRSETRGFRCASDAP